MNIIRKESVENLGYNFVPKEFLSCERDEYFLRNQQNISPKKWHTLLPSQIELLKKNNNTSDNWNNVLTADGFNPLLVKNCNFYGLIRIGKLEEIYLEFSDTKYRVGLYNSVIISSDIGDNVVVDNVNYLSHYIIGDEVILVNVNEIGTTDHSKFGNGIIKDGEDESLRISLEICNENGGRNVLPFDGMQPADAFLWSKYRDDDALMNQFKSFTEKAFPPQRGFYGIIGERSVVKNCGILKDVKIGKDAYIKGANKLKNLTINSGDEGKTQIGEGCELVNGIVGFGCRIFYGVKAVRFIMSSHSQLKYGARLINSYLGSNATISCCEVLNSLIFPLHEQHHNNSFLCAALIMGQSNIPAGATIGSNHNSRAADGEVIAGRGFWPGLCVNLKHNSKFASFTILAKGNYDYELNIPIPFSLVSVDEAKDQLTIMPAYWFMYNFYALTRNAWKYKDRDKRIEKILHLEHDFLAPDTVNEMFDALKMMELYAGKSFIKKYKNQEANSSENIGKELFDNDSEKIDELVITTQDFENSKRETVFIKVREAYNIYKRLISFYGIQQLINYVLQENINSINTLKPLLANSFKREKWLNVGGQLMPVKEISIVKEKIKSNEIDSWKALHNAYQEAGSEYQFQKLKHALASLQEIKNISLNELTKEVFFELLDEVVAAKEWIIHEIYDSRAKDYNNPFRKMSYENQQEMDAVLGKLDENAFINQQKKETEEFILRVKKLKENFQ